MAVVCSQDLPARCALPAASLLVLSVQISVFQSPWGEQPAEHISAEPGTSGADAGSTKPETLEVDLQAGTRLQVRLLGPPWI